MRDLLVLWGIWLQAPAASVDAPVTPSPDPWKRASISEDDAVWWQQRKKRTFKRYD